MPQQPLLPPVPLRRVQRAGGLPAELLLLVMPTALLQQLLELLFPLLPPPLLPQALLLPTAAARQGGAAARGDVPGRNAPGWHWLHPGCR